MQENKIEFPRRKRPVDYCLVIVEHLFYAIAACIVQIFIRPPTGDLLIFEQSKCATLYAVPWSAEFWSVKKLENKYYLLQSNRSCTVMFFYQFWPTIGNFLWAERAKCEQSCTKLRPLKKLCNTLRFENSGTRLSLLP